MVVITDVNVILAHVHTACSIKALLVYVHQFTKTMTSTGAQGRERLSKKLVLLTVPVTLVLGQLEKFSKKSQTVLNKN